MRRFYYDGERCPLHELLKCCHECEPLNLGWFSLTDFFACTDGIKNPIYQQFMEEIKPHILKEFICDEWYGHRYKGAVIYIFPYSHKIFDDILKKYTHDLFMGDCIIAGSTIIPQDMNIFRTDGSTFLGSVSHERIADVYLKDEELASFPLPPGFFEGKTVWETIRLLIGEDGQVRGYAHEKY